jgi:hypothetical protein
MNELYFSRYDIPYQQDFILGGDFNAACTYVRPADWANIRLRQDSRFLWVIGDSIDTTATTTNCAYDRSEHNLLIIVFSEHFMRKSFKQVAAVAPLKMIFQISLTEDFDASAFWAATKWTCNELSSFIAKFQPYNDTYILH